MTEDTVGPKSDELEGLFEDSKKYHYVLPIAITLMVLSIFPLSYGLAGKILIISIPSGFVFVLSLCALILFAIHDNRINRQIFAKSDEVLTEMSIGINSIISDRVKEREAKRILLNEALPNSFLH